MAKSKLQVSNKRVNYEQIDTIVGSDITFIGDLAAGGNVRYEGNLKGNVNLAGNIIVGRNAFIAGNINAKNVHIIGTVEGIVTCEQLKILSTGKLTGDVYVDNIIIDEGAIFIGACKTKVADMEDETQISEAMASDKDVDLDTKESEEA
ncbi:MULTISPECIES: polymer-forming cytoskeletal protein [Anaerofustis]|uniref:bactofilin family protein n=1 Tax=Anaerofustis TaxID=264995 RepID=UPI00110615FF|nr:MULTISPECIES: polymer-forming cytoskeletal protein [Anaerofustis]MCO8193109.1 polymer-forming cytoskeletal protein [Anaerofustis sp. NSJ-163]